MLDWATTTEILVWWLVSTIAASLVFRFLTVF